MLAEPGSGKTALLEHIGRLTDATTAKEALRALVEKIMLSPKPDGDGLTIDLHGALAGLLRLATGWSMYEVAQGRHANAASGGRRETVDNIAELVLVAGASNHLKLRLLSAYRAVLEQSALAQSSGLLRSAA